MTNSIPCPVCQNTCSIQALSCPKCGHPFSQKRISANTALLEDAIRPYQKRGFNILQQSEMSITMGLPKQMDGCLFIFLILIFFPAAILYAIMSNRTAYETAHFRVTSEGTVEISGYKLRTETEKQTKPRNYLITEPRNALIVVGLIVTIIIILFSAYWLASFFKVSYAFAFFLLCGLAAFIAIMFKKEIFRLATKEE